ncbi:MAG: RIP metalloprotease RseP [Phycisphaerales bacterium]|nr:MAG: RIP metalloprotease RseP [Phycisphaerales bacterium]
MLTNPLSHIAALVDSPGLLAAIWPYVLIFMGFSAVIFVHELGHFLVAKWCGIRVEKFAVGFFREIWGFTRGETRYSFNVLPLGGYVKMLGQEDFEVDKSGELMVKDDPRAYSNKSVGQRMVVISAGVVMNLLFAGVLFAIVFMIGLPSQVTKVGYVVPNGPADQAGILHGDVIKQIDGKPIRDFKELTMAIVLAEPLEEMEFTVDRKGTSKTVDVIPINTEEKSVQQIGIGPALTRTVVLVGPDFDPKREDAPRFGDKVVSINGKEVTDENANDLIYMMGFKPTIESRVIVERPADPDDEDSPTRRVELSIPSRLVIKPRGLTRRGTVDVLGLTPLARVDFVEPGGRAWLGGLEVGDVILKWGDVGYPTRSQIIKETASVCRRKVNDGPDVFDTSERDVPVRVLRPATGEELSLIIRPRVKRTLAQKIARAFSGYGPGLPRIGASFDFLADNVTRIGAIVAEADGKPTPASAAGIPPGALITKVNGVPVSRWVQLVEQLRVNAGRSVTLAYVSNGASERTCELAVPESIRTKLGLGPQARILAINGEQGIKKKTTYGIRATEQEIERYISASHPVGTRALLKDAAGQTVEVRYLDHFLAEPQTVELAVTEDMLDPWLGRIMYTMDLGFAQEQKTIRETNPLSAMGVGAKKTYYFVLQVYVIMKRMIFSRSVGVENISGPVGIVKIGGQVAQAGWPQMLFFLAMISANLAVINFLPLPIVDGGHMIFLIIEKVKGSPISIKIQMATQVVGLALIITLFLYVTLQDLMK